MNELWVKRRAEEMKEVKDRPEINPKSRELAGANYLKLKQRA
jgi:hypothetical protein